MTRWAPLIGFMVAFLVAYARERLDIWQGQVPNTLQTQNRFPKRPSPRPPPVHGLRWARHGFVPEGWCPDPMSHLRRIFTMFASLAQSQTIQNRSTLEEVQGLEYVRSCAWKLELGPARSPMFPT